MKRFCSLALLFFLLLSGCAGGQRAERFSLYFLPGQAAAGPALDPVSFTPDPALSPEDALLSALLAGPEDDGHLSPFPEGVRVRYWSLRDGLLTVNLSEQYSGLSGIRLTLADYSIALTLCQLPQVERVMVTVENSPLAFRDRPILSPEDVLLSDALPEEGD